MCRVFVCVCFFLYVFLSFSFRRFMFLMHCSIFFFRLCVIFCLFSFCVCMFCFVFSSLYRSLNILFVLLITGCFCLRSRIFIRLNKSAFFALFCEWFMFAFALWMVSFSMTLCGHAAAFTACGFCFAVFVWVLFTHSLSFKYLDQRVGFFHCFLMISFCCFA